MTPDALYLAADIIQTLGRIALTLILLGIIVTVVLILTEAFTDAGRRIDAAPIPTGTRGADRYDYPASWATWGECPRCGKGDCWCDRDGDGWRDLMDAARDEEHDFAAWEQEVTR